PVATPTPAVATPTPAVATPTPRPPAARDEARVVYEVDFAKASQCLARFEDRKRISLDGTFPRGWTASSWRTGATAEVGIQDWNGFRAAVVRTTSGDGWSAEMHTTPNTAPY
ncbi:MAG: hypothetical protein J2P46_07800, partial [Zavarzinella sp.]|nr:hypothetical protein [Zavarzinella sp.]